MSVSRYFFCCAGPGCAIAWAKTFKKYDLKIIIPWKGKIYQKRKNFPERIDEMYNYYTPNQQTQQQPVYRMPITQISGLKGRPVASVEEARAATIDFDGSIFFFPDLANKRIYTKQINIDGTMLLNMYELKEVPVEDNLNPNLFITREEFENAINQLKDEINAAVSVSTPAEPPAREFKF